MKNVFAHRSLLRLRQYIKTKLTQLEILLQYIKIKTYCNLLKIFVALQLGIDLQKKKKKKEPHVSGYIVPIILYKELRASAVELCD